VSEALNSVKRKIRALSAKTIENGCTEQEAIAAMEMCGKLLAQHNLEMSETDIREQGCKEDYLRVNSKNINNNIGMLLSSIAMFVDAKPWIKNGHDDKGFYKAYTLFGQEADIEMGSYLLFICTTAMLNDAHKYVRSLGVQQGGARTPSNSFQHGFALRIYRRLKEIKDANKVAQVATTGTALILLKDQLVTEEWQKRQDELGLKQRQASKAQIDGHAYKAGTEAANKVNLQRPIENGGQADRVSGPNKLLA
jgi:hypothetical protein